MNLTRRSVLASAPAVMLAQSSSNEFRAAYIGVGNRGSYTMKALMKVPGVRMVAVADIDEERLRAALSYIAEQGGKADGYADFRKMLERKDIDGVVIATPVDTHRAIAIAALEAGVNVYLEKPVGLNPDDCNVVAAATRSAKGILQVGFQLRHEPRRAASMQFIKSGGIGDVIYCHAMRHGGDLPRNTPWLFDKKRSGDIIVEQACHIIDLMVWAIGAPPVRAMGSGGINLFKDVPPGRSVMDNWSCIWEFPGGVRLNFSQIYFDPRGFSGTNERVFGTKGAIDLAKAEWGEVEKNEPLKKLDVDVKPGVGPEYYAFESWIRDSRAKATPRSSVETGALSTKVAVMGRMAIEQRRIIEWSEVG